MYNVASGLSGTTDTVTVTIAPFDRAAMLAAMKALPAATPGVLDRWARPPSVQLTDGTWVSLIHGVGINGDFAEGKDPLTGKYWPGDALINSRPVYYDDLGIVPYMDPDGFTAKSPKDFTDYNATVAAPNNVNNAVAITPIAQTPTMVSQTPTVVLTTKTDPATGTSTTTVTNPGAGATTSDLFNVWGLLAGVAALAAISSHRRA